MTQPFRSAAGGVSIDRSRPVDFSFDGRRLAGLAGDTLASALLANGVRLIGRGYKYHRPRGIYAAGPEEPSAIVGLRSGARSEPNTRATMIELFDGLEAVSQNRWPSLGFDVLAIHGLFSGLLAAGFAYKTFMWPRKAWMIYERFIRRAAGMGAAVTGADPDRYERHSAHCDVLVVGGGPAGLAAARAAADSGARVMLCDERAEMGGSLLRENDSAGGTEPAVWARSAAAGLAAMANVVLLPRTTAFGYFDHNMIGLAERVADHLPVPQSYAPRQRLWSVRARQVVFATGAIERPMVFPDNDRPGVMLAAAARAYVNQYGALPGRRAVVFTNNDDAYRTALDLHRSGVAIPAVVDVRAGGGGALATRAAAEGIEILPGHAVVATHGARSLSAVDVAPRDRGGTVRTIDCDVVAVSGGWNPAVHLHSQSGGKLEFDEALAAFVPGAGKQSSRSAGAASGHLTLRECLEEGTRAGADAAAAAGFRSERLLPAAAAECPQENPLEPVWLIPPARRGQKCFVDIQDDVTADDLALAWREGYVSVEHLKRYTTLGMGTDQGKTSNINGLAIMAKLRGIPVPQVGTTTFRPPYTPITMGILVGRETGRHFAPTRRSPMHEWHESQGAVMVEAGLWLRPRCYPRTGENPAQAIQREAAHVRKAVGLVDVSTLGKIDVQGPDATEFLQRVYANNWGNLPAGKARYGLMLREDGVVFDDGTTARIGEFQYFMTTTTANAGKVMSHLEQLLEVVWPALRVQVTSVTDQWASMALAGPRSRDVLARALEAADVSDGRLPFMGVLDGTISGLPVRIFRISFSGELAYEINTPAGCGLAVWEALLAAGRDAGIAAYGTEAMGVLRIEKGHVAGAELDGRTTAADLGLGRLVARNKPDFVGKHLLDRPALADAARPQLVGLVPVDGKTRLRGGAQLVEDPNAPLPATMLGHVTSVAWSPTLGHPIGLALLAHGRSRKGQIVHALFPLRQEQVAVRVVDPVFVDPEGVRLHA